MPIVGMPKEIGEKNEKYLLFFSGCIAQMYKVIL